MTTMNMTLSLGAGALLVLWMACRLGRPTLLTLLVAATLVVSLALALAVTSADMRQPPLEPETVVQ